MGGWDGGGWGGYGDGVGVGWGGWVGWGMRVWLQFCCQRAMAITRKIHPMSFKPTQAKPQLRKQCLTEMHDTSALS